MFAIGNLLIYLTGQSTLQRKLTATERTVSPAMTRVTARSRKSIEYGLGITADLQPAGSLNQNSAAVGIPLAIQAKFIPL
jgi:hypothetical protein